MAETTLLWNLTQIVSTLLYSMEHLLPSVLELVLFPRPCDLQQ
jgi:hypothetical protein